MSRYIGKYVSTCDLYLRTKALKQHPTGELHPLPIPDSPWDTISVDVRGLYIGIVIHLYTPSPPSLVLVL